MNTKDTILLNLGIGTADDMCDTIITNFDVELEDADIKETIQDHSSNLGEVGNALIGCLYNKVTDKGFEEYGLKRQKFTHYLNMQDSHIYYDGEEIHSTDDLERLSKEQQEDGAPEDNPTEVNRTYLEENDFKCIENDNDWELESYTDGGGDMIITLEELTKEALVEYLENFDVNEETSIWWPDGKPGRGVPFDNIKDLYDDIENWRKWALKIAKRMPY